MLRHIKWVPEIKYFLIGLVGFGAVQLVLYVILFLGSFELWPCGNDYLDDRFIDGLHFYSLAGLAVIQMLIGVRLLKNKLYKYAGWAGILTNVVTLYIVFVIGVKYLDYDNYYTQFSEIEWKKTPDKSIQMVRYIVNNKVMTGKNKNEVLQLLGQGEESWNEEDNQWYYRTVDPYSPFVIEFEQDTVLKCYLECYD